MLTTAPPSPPLFGSFTLDGKGNLVVRGKLRDWRTIATGATVHTLDTAGKRVTATRAVIMGPLALLAKKRTVEVTVIVSGKDGSSSHPVTLKGKDAEKVLTWAVAFNAWSEAQA